MIKVKWYNAKLTWMEPYTHIAKNTWSPDKDMCEKGNYISLEMFSKLFCKFWLSRIQFFIKIYLQITLKTN